MSESEKTGQTDLDIDELIELVTTAKQSGKHGPNLGRITDISRAPDFVNVQPLLARIVQGQPRLHPELQEVPVAWPGTPQGQLTFPLAVGGTVELVPQAGDLSAWINSGAETPSANERTQALSDVVALPLRPHSKASPSPGEGYSASAVVLFAMEALLLGDNSATQLVGLDVDPIPFHSDGLFLTWCTQVETAINALAPGAVSPLIALIQCVGQIESTARKVKAI